jgi:Mce-associated membrane protein
MMMVVTAKKDPEVEDETPESTTDDASAEETQVEDSEDLDATAADDGDEQTDADDEDNVLLKSNRTKAQRLRRPWRPYLRRSLLPLLLIASLAVSGFLGWKQWQEHQVKLAGQHAQQAAVAYAQVLTSIDSNKVDENFRQVLDGATGEFKDMYTQSSVQLRQ